MSDTEHNKAAARGIFDTLDHGDLDALDAIVGPNYVLHDPGLPEEVRGVEGAKQMIEAYRTAFGLRVTIEHQFADGDYVATRYTARGRHDAEFMGVPPTGKAVTVAGICITRCDGGKVVEEWDAWDALGALQQVGGLTETVAG
jgi:steroid delta-isomerase-like uncharacterized protein